MPDPVGAEPVLLRVDRKLWIVLGSLLLVLTLGTAFKLHGSSIAAWNLVDQQPVASVLLGKPRFLRVDEWGFITPAIISQARVRPAYPVVNPSWGSTPFPLIFNLPCRHWSMFVRPQFWGFFVLDLERAFAFYWNMKICLLLGGTFLLLMLLTRNDFEVSLLGAAWVYFSGFTQWWFSSPNAMPEMIGYAALLLVALHFLILSSRRIVIGGAAVVSAVCLLNVALALYPAFQVPLLYLCAAILIGSLGPRLLSALGNRNLGFRCACGLAALTALAAGLVAYYHDAAPAIELMRNTDYPGARISSGGELTLAEAFGGFFGFFISESSVPRLWPNPCEASNFVLLAPVAIAALVWRACRKRRATALEWSLAVYFVVILSWTILPWPRVVALASGFSMSPGNRSLLGLGLGSILLCCVFLAQRRTDLPGTLGRRIFVALSMPALVALFALEFNRATGGFVTIVQAAIVSVLAGGAGFLLLARKRRAFAACLLVPSILSYGLVNPVAVGLGPMIDMRLFKEVARIVDRDPDARWTVFRTLGTATLYIPELYKAAGARVFNGLNVVPPLDDFRVIDPESTKKSTYNRFAHIGLVPEAGPEVAITFISVDFYAITIDPMNDIWRRLGVKYCVLPFPVSNPTFRDATSLVLEMPGAWVYEYKWDLATAP